MFKYVVCVVYIQFNIEQKGFASDCIAFSCKKNTVSLMVHGQLKAERVQSKPEQCCPLFICSQTPHVLFHLIQLKCFTALLHSKSQWCETEGWGACERPGGVSALLYGCSKLSYKSLLVCSLRHGMEMILGLGKKITCPSCLEGIGSHNCLFPFPRQMH